MNKAVLAIQKLVVIILLSTLTACTDNAVIDTSQEISARNWGYDNKVNFPVKIEDASKAYNIYFNLRHTAEYRYSNIFVLVHQVGGSLKPITERREFQLAYPDGEWLGSGSGNLYSYQVKFRENYKFPKPGIYNFSFEQNMRDNPLREISDVGIRVETAK
ncbi:gliding motility lipoprotein GldH [Desertivirga arenae]|uniref:gliding motility lipoprotein GldH n=1 Tax=Desertivirga arenae TaxID=2810309 RepID=UPI001A9729C4|nr:gliding motility lipoprotein GldH [Pedobacter sp. SYSU D00823]